MDCFIKKIFEKKEADDLVHNQFTKFSKAGIMIFLTLCSEIARSPAISEISPAILEKIIMSFSNHRRFQFSNHR